MSQYLIKYLIDHAADDLAKKYIDFFKIELDWHIYNGDSHISKKYYRDKKIELKAQLINLFQYSRAVLSPPVDVDREKKNVLSTVYFPRQDAISELGYNLFSPVWHPLGKKNIFGDLKTVRWHLEIQDLIRDKDFYLYLDSKLHAALEDFQYYLLSQYQRQDFRALFLYTDQYFYSKYCLDIFKKMQKPSFIFLHGLPGIYSKEVDNRSDYLLVWGEKIKENYLAAGFDDAKVKVVGHPKFGKLPKNKTLRSDLSDILVIPFASAIYHQHSYNDTIIIDKSMVVLYLYQVQSVLMRMGVKKARYRVHPTINKEWVHKFLDQIFYIQDNQLLTDSLQRSSLLIGATSTLLLESLIQGVNYIVFEPTDDAGKNMTGYESVPPFDGSTGKVLVAKDESELEAILKANALTEFSLIHDYIQDFDLSVLKGLIN